MKNSKLSTKFILLFTAILTGIFAVMLAVVQISMNTSMRGYVRDSIYSYHEDVDKSVTAVIDEVAYAYSRMIRRDNSDTLDKLKSDNGYGVRQQALQSLVSDAQSDMFADVGWRDGGGYLSVNGYPCPSESVFAAAEKQRNRVVVGDYKNGCHSFVIYLDSNVTSAEGCFVFFMPESAVAYCFTGFGSETGYSYIIRTDGYIFSHGDKDYVGKLFFYENLYRLDGNPSMESLKMGGEKKIVIVSPMRTVGERYGFDFNIVSILDYSYYYGTFEILTYVLAAVTAAVFLSGVAVAVFRAKKLSKPVSQLYSDIDKTIKTGEKGALKLNEKDELFKLEEKYDELITHIFDLMQKAASDAETQRKLELDTLQMQINPHFLYNTLDAISWMAKLKQEAEIENLAVNLAQFFRLSLHKGDKFITVGEELELTAHYLVIDRIRFPEKVKVKFETDETLLNYKVLKLILQPVVENAVKYAFVEKDGNLTVRTMLSGPDIVFEVEDDGVGFDADGEAMKNKNKSDLGGFGLFNVNERIKLEYGDGYGLEVFSRKGKGTKVVIRIAKRI